MGCEWRWGREVGEMVACGDGDSEWSDAEWRHGADVGKARRPRRSRKDAACACQEHDEELSGSIWRTQPFLLGT